MKKLLCLLPLLLISQAAYAEVVIQNDQKYIDNEELIRNNYRLVQLLDIDVNIQSIQALEKSYERKEIKDIIAYLRLVSNLTDNLAFERIINVPKRSIGDSTLKNIHEFAKKNNLSLEKASNKMLEKNKSLIHISELTRLRRTWYADFCLNKKHNIFIE